MRHWPLHVKISAGLSVLQIAALLVVAFLARTEAPVDSLPSREVDIVFLISVLVFLGLALPNAVLFVYGLVKAAKSKCYYPLQYILVGAVIIVWLVVSHVRIGHSV